MTLKPRLASDISGALHEGCARRYAQTLSFLLGIDPPLARRARDAIAKSIAKLEEFPFSCRRVSHTPPFLHELIIPFGSAGYIALFEVEDNGTVTILAVRHQREAD